MAFNFGGPVMTETVPDETAAQRENRDVENRGVEDKYTEIAGGSVRDGSCATLSTVAFDATGGRKNREYTQRVDHRNDYEYVNYADGTSAISGAKSATFDASKANTGKYPF